MDSHRTRLCTFLLGLHLCLASSQNQTHLTSPGALLGRGCPQYCQCSPEFKGHMDVACSFGSQPVWEETCKALEQLSHVRQAKLKIKLAGVGDTFSSGLGCLPRLASLDISEIALKPTFQMFQGLNIDGSLNLSANKLESFPGDTFSGVENIGGLDLSHNRLLELNASSFAGLESIENLDLSHNNITIIHLGALSNMSQLKSLNLASNKLRVFSFKQLSLNTSLDFLSLRDNFLTSLYLESNKTEVVPFHIDSQFDISENLIECSCSLAYFLQALPFPENSLLNVDNTLCDAPDNFKGQSIAHLDTSGLVCTAPEIFMSYPLKQKDLLTTSSIILECHANGFPRPTILWVTPWGDVFLHDQAHIPNSLREHLKIGTDEIKAHRKYKEQNVLLITHIKADVNGHLVISKIRGSMHGNYSCLAFNPAGNVTKVIDLSLYCGIKSTYTFSLILGGYCASGFLIFGFLVGFIKMVVVWLKHKLYFMVPYFSKAVSTVAGVQDQDCSASGCYSVNVNPRSGDSSANCGESSITCPHSPASLSFIEEEYFPDEEQECGQAVGGISAHASRQHRFRDTLEEARGRWRDGVERKMELVRKNVQHIRESSSNYVHNIKETGSSAALRMKAGVAHGVETVKYQLQSFKELCGTGDMGTNTISTVTLETDIDSHQQSKVVKQMTFV
ncbi:leucine-rich repeat-containing protein 4C-like [Elysia marginata]|uniref:Leucine-rich repeat-containing protein 4C-like n=1 Tax=Elysia marginata TaxID=1093978 RepID=A0AAV4JM82_9GAST|nr:leucine-rich repeat-containing protein 4C-like [Elysia marginata]